LILGGSVLWWRRFRRWLWRFWRRWYIRRRRSQWWLV